MDEDKLTFIILACVKNQEGIHTPPIEFLPYEELSPTDTRVSSLPMIGDVNIFLKGSAPQSSNHLELERPLDGDDEDHNIFEAEVEIMIAGELLR